MLNGIAFYGYATVYLRTCGLASSFFSVLAIMSRAAVNIIYRSLCMDVAFSYLGECLEPKGFHMVGMCLYFNVLPDWLPVWLTGSKGELRFF